MDSKAFAASCASCKYTWYQDERFTLETAICSNCGDRDHIIFIDARLEMERRGIKFPFQYKAHKVVA